MLTTIQLPSKNITAFAVSATLLGASEYWHLENLFLLAFVVGVVAGISVMATLITYTIKYIFGKENKKCKKQF